MNKEISPEEKLLNLIKSKNEPPAEQKSLQDENTASESIKEPHPATSSETGNISIKKIRKINALLKGVTGILVFLFIFQFSTHWWKTSRLDHFKVKNTSRLPRRTEKTLPDIDIDKMEKKFLGRQLFKVFFIQSRGPLKSTKKTSIKDMIKYYQLAGIIMEEKPTAIIYDRKTRQNIYLREGDAFNEMEVISISSNSVTLAYGNEEIELSL
jgi:hypothetical protein